MRRISIGGRSYSDPDVISLIEKSGGEIDPRTAVISRARELNARLRVLGTVENPRERLRILASLAGVAVRPMLPQVGISGPRRDGLIYQDQDGRRLAYFDPSPSEGRANFSIAHEIVHTFFPNSRSGARFRNLHLEDSREANELERLCDLGAAELLMPREDFQEATRGQMGFHLVPELSERFGSSFEATAFRLATAFDGIAVSGLLQYRLRKGEADALRTQDQQLLFEGARRFLKEAPQPRYRRQSFHSSPRCPAPLVVPWNKSFDSDSSVYGNLSGEKVAFGKEKLPVKDSPVGNIEACVAPYQRPASDGDHPDLLFLWWVPQY